MNFKRKLQKIFHPDGLRSAQEHLRRLAHPVDRRPMLRALDPARLAAVRARYLDARDGGGVGNSAKFADADYWLKVNVERAQDLGLDRRKGLRILDLGCGAGYFLYVCERLGHEAVGVDLDENPLYREMTALLGVRRVVGRIEAFSPLPELPGKFDLVTSHCICFQKTTPLPGEGQWREWQVEEWRFFLNTLRDEVLQPNGKILLDFNPRASGHHYPADVQAYFRAQGGRLFRSKVFLNAAALAA